MGAKQENVKKIDIIENYGCLGFIRLLKTLKFKPEFSVFYYKGCKSATKSIASASLPRTK